MTTPSMPAAERTFLVECYVPGLARDAMAAASLRARAASTAISTDGTAVRYIGAVVVPDDELVFHMFRAPDVAVVREVAGRAGLDLERIVESIVVGRFEFLAGLSPVPADPR